MAFTVLQVLDLLTTYIGGIHNEANPVGRLLIAQYGFMGLVYGKGLLISWFLVTVALLRRMRCPLERPYTILLIGMYVIVVAWNIRYLILR